MAKTLDNLLVEFGLASQDSQKSHEKAASAPAKDEVTQVLESLGLSSNATETESTVKVANDKSQEGGTMNLTQIYDELFAAEEGTTKVASAEGATTAESNEAASPESLFGEMVAHYFSAGHEAFLSKIADESPMAHAGHSGQLTGVIGVPADPRLPVNHSASSGAHLQVSTGGHSPYSLKGAMIKATLKRRMSAEAGDVGGYHQT